jgi:putative oxidoreductase
MNRVTPLAQDGVLLALRALYGFQFAQTGFGKLTNLERTTTFFDSLGLPFAAAQAVLAGSTELVFGLLLFVGFLSRGSALALSTVLATAYLTAHRADAFVSLEAFTEQAPYPYLVASLVVLAFGAGRASLDGFLARRARARAP